MGRFSATCHPSLLTSPLYHDALGSDPHHLGYLPALVTVRVVVFLEHPFQLLQLVCRKKRAGGSQSQ